MPKKELIYQGKALILNREWASFPDGREGELEIVRHPGGAAVAAINERAEVCLIRQFRYAVGGWIWELPAGRREAGEDPQRTAQRELAEEVGLQAQHWQSLGELLPSPGIFDERIFLYLAQGLTQVPHSHDELEYIEVHWLTLKQAVDLAINGEITDAKTLAGLVRAKALMGV